jgi:hypothetical protein
MLTPIKNQQSKIKNYWAFLGWYPWRARMRYSWWTGTLTSMRRKLPTGASESACTAKVLPSQFRCHYAENLFEIFI